MIVINVLLPIFALILIGYVCRKTLRLGATAASELNRFVVWLCLPALLFKSTATATLSQIWHPQFIAVFCLSTLSVFIVTLLIRFRAKKNLAEASLDGLSASYANTGYIGIPLCLLVAGPAGLEPALIATLIVVCLLFSLSVICIEVALQTESSWHQAARKVLISLCKNPLVVSPILGAGWGVSGAELPTTLLQFLTMLGSATTPCALVSLGAFLAHRQTGSGKGSMQLVGIKLIVHPLMTWVLAFYVFHLPPLWAKTALLLSALPSGTGPFMLAEYYRREASVVSRVILLSTLVSLITLSLCIYLIG